jgi:hypothetical protein
MAPRVLRAEDLLDFPEMQGTHASVVEVKLLKLVRRTLTNKIESEGRKLVAQSHVSREVKLLY